VVRSRSLVLLIGTVCTAQVGRDWGVERTSYTDPVTRIQVTDLVRGPSQASNLYFHFSNFTADQKYIILSSDRSGSGQIFKVEAATGRITQLTDGKGVASTAACPHPTNAELLYYPREAQIVELNINTLKERVVGAIPGLTQGASQQPTLSHDHRNLTLAFQRDTRTWEIGLMEIANGRYRRVLTQGFRIGHAQHHPLLPRIFYVWETGGYAPQRTWLVEDDGSGNRPFYYRTDPKEWFTPLKEWVTHESWISKTGEMTLILDKVGIMIADADGKARLLQGDYWHCAARPDGQRIAADDNAGRLWLVESRSGSRRLLATGIRDTVRAVHAHASFDHTGRYVLFNNGRSERRVSIIDLSTLPGADWSRWTP